MRSAYLLALLLCSWCAAQPNTTTTKSAKSPASYLEEYPWLRFVESKLRIESRVPAEVPVVFELCILNSTQERARIMTTGPGVFPEGNRFSAIVTDSNGTRQTFIPGNGQYSQGRMDGCVLEPGEELHIPLSIDPLSPGRYSIELVTGKDRFTEKPAFPELKPAHWDFEVVDDPALCNQWLEHHLAQARSGDPFSDYLAAWRQVPTLMDGLLDDLRSRDEARILRSARVFARRWQNKPSEELVQALTEALTFRADHPPTTRPANGENWGAALCLAAGRAYKADFDDVLLRLCEDPDWDTRDMARMYVSKQNRERATELFAKGLDDPNWAIRWNTAWHFVSDGQVRGLPVFIQFAIDPETKPSQRKSAFQILARFPHDENASKALQDALASNDPKIRDMAKQAVDDAQKHAQSHMFP